MTPEGKAALADIFLKGLNDRIDKSEADCKHYRERIAKLERENAKLREACETVLAWYDRDGSVGGACDPMERLRAAVDAAMKGERT